MTSRPAVHGGAVPTAVEERPQSPAAAPKVSRRLWVYAFFRRILDPLPPVWMLLLSLALVALTTGLLSYLQSFLIHSDGQPHIRPYGIGYLVSVMLMTALGGRRAGLFTLLLSCVAASFFLSQPYHTWHIGSDRSVVEIAFLLSVGLCAVSGVGAMRERAAVLTDITDTVRGAEIVCQVREAVTTVPGILQLQTCLVRRRGFDLSVDADVSVESTLVQSAVRGLTDRAEGAIRRANPLVFHVRVRAH